MIWAAGLCPSSQDTKDTEVICDFKKIVEDIDDETPQLASATTAPELRRSRRHANHADILFPD